MNDSTSPISPAWPTRWPKNSFKSIWTWVLAGGIALPFIALFLLSLAIKPPSIVSATEIDELFLAQGIAEAILVTVVLLALGPLSKFSLRELGFRMPSLATLGIAVIGAIAMVIVANGSAELINLVAHSQHEQDIVAIFKNLHDIKAIAIFAVFAVLFAPFAEETLFRLLFFNIGLRYGGFWVGAILSGLLFGIAHGDVYAVLPLALGGIVLCTVYYRTRNAFASMISHSLFNTFSIAMLLIAPQATR